MKNKSLDEIEKSTKNFLSTSEAAAVLGISLSTLRKRADEYSELFPIQRVGKIYRIPTAPFIAYVRTGKSWSNAKVSATSSPKSCSNLCKSA